MTEKITVLPKPNGQFHVGRTHLNFIDENRVDPSPLAEGKKRDIPILIWYPIDDPGTIPPLKFIKPQDLDSLKKLFIYAIVPDSISNVVTNSHGDAPISDKIRNFPVLIFNHGLTGFMEQNTTLTEHMASHGYIIVSIGHPYDGVASYSDGRSIPMNVNYYKEYFEKSMSEEENKKFEAFLNQIRREDISIGIMRELTEKNLLNEDLLNNQIDVWVDDVLFIGDILERMNEGVIISQFEEKMDIERGIGVLGHSYGGATAILSCCLDKRFKCAVNMDGGMYGGLKKHFKYEKPSMFMDSGENAGMNKFFYSINENDTYSVHIKDSTHFDYSDISYILKDLLSERPEVFGKIDGNLMVRITNDYVLSFFNKYIKGNDAPLLESNPYNEVTFKKHL